MKNYILTSVKFLTSVACCTMLFLNTACDTQNEQVFPTEPELEESYVKIPKTPLEFKGKSLFSVYSILHKYFIADPEFIYLEVVATLTHVKGQDYILQTNEYFPGTIGIADPYRTVNFDAKISKGGVIKMYWPFEWMEGGVLIQDAVINQMMMHTGYIYRGPGVNKGTMLYNGRYDGKKLVVASRLIAKQIKPGIFPLYEEVVDGPIIKKLTLDLNLNQPPLTSIN